MSLPNELSFINNQEIKDIILTIKEIQKRMNLHQESSMKFPVMYEKLTNEFKSFSKNFPFIFDMVLHNKSLETIASALYYRNRMENNEINEKQITKQLVDKYFPDDIKEKLNDLQDSR